MKIKRFLNSLSAFFVVLLIGCILAIPVSAEGDLDGLTGGDVSQGEQQDDASSGNNALGNYLENYEPLDDESMEEANKLASPITNIVGTAVGIIVLLTAAGIFLVTACDLAYIGMPFTRNLLTSGKYRMVSDEAMSVVGQGGAQSGNNGMNAGGIGMNSGGIGMNAGGIGMNAGGIGMQPGGINQSSGAHGQQGGTKSLILEYLKKRAVFIVIFTVAALLLTSSILTGVGINLAALLFDVLEKVKNMLGGINIG